MHFHRIIAAIFVSFFHFSFASSPLQEMTVEEKIGQVLMVCFKGQEASADAKTLIQKVHVGGIIYYNWANGLTSWNQVRDLSASLQKLSGENRLPIPLLIAVDQEGGIVARLTQEFTVFPGNKALGMTGDIELAERAAFAMGQEMRAVGVNFNLAPVVDVNSNPRNPIIGIRSFGDSAERVAIFGKSAIQGYHKADVLTCLKHFPGHGDVEVDSHQDLPVVNKSKEQLQKVELLPFSALATQTDAVMTAHVMVPSIDPVHCATLSKNILNILRKEMEFEGVIVADSLVMQGLLNNCPLIEEAAIKAFNAGCDILMFGGRQLVGSGVNEALSVAEIEKIHKRLVDALKNGEISQARLDEAVERILKLKNKYALTVTPREKINSQEHQKLSQKIASCAVRVVEHKPIVSLQEKKVAVFAPSIVQDAIGKTALLHMGKETSTLFFNGLSLNQEEMAQANKKAQEADTLVVCSYNAWKNPSQVALVDALAKLQKPLVVIALRDPLDATLFPQADLILSTFSPTAVSIEAACERIK